MARLNPPNKEQMIAHIEHEFAQFRGSLAEFSALDDPCALSRNRDDPERIRRTAFFECFLLHARVLDEFLGQLPRKDDDFTAGAFTDSWTRRSPIGEVDPITPGGLSVRDRINKQLTHLTTSRVDQQQLPIAAIAAAVLKVFREFLNHPDICTDPDFFQLLNWAYATWGTTKPPISSGS
ncbi:hypothetical protein MSS2_04763 [Mycobacterium marinum]|uniref:hypothetical protein n=1 Tax=Mycobacterium marinum TaxID=1781 RepID=UPI000E3E22C2|nr:hypothetical protein [Mycobacterium marinum]RFZ48247.1 hypothetical protein MSS2_04763 [Mycobacterium marinum]